MVKGYRYFTCKPNYGIFARPEKVEMNVREDEEDEEDDGATNGGATLDLDMVDDPNFDLSGEAAKLAEEMLDE